MHSVQCFEVIFVEKIAILKSHCPGFFSGIPKTKEVYISLLSVYVYVKKIKNLAILKWFLSKGSS